MEILFLKLKFYLEFLINLINQNCIYVHIYIFLLIYKWYINKENHNQAAHFVLIEADYHLSASINSLLFNHCLTSIV